MRRAQEIVNVTERWFLSSIYYFDEYSRSNISGGRLAGVYHLSGKFYVLPYIGHLPLTLIAGQALIGLISEPGALIHDEVMARILPLAIGDSCVYRGSNNASERKTAQPLLDPKLSCGLLAIVFLCGYVGFVKLFDYGGKLTRG